MNGWLKSGDRLGQYEVISAIGAGGMGRVYRARDSRLRRDVAIKVLAPGRAVDREMRARFEREARSAAALSHPGIVAIHELGVAGDVPFIVMEFLTGRNLRARLDAGPMPLPTSACVIAHVADALAAAHGAGIMHRDLKPENIFLTRAGGVKLLDFGLARRAAGGDDDCRLTAANIVIGTLRYMSPEQARGEPTTVASDVFSLGLLLFELVTGTHAFKADSVVGLLQAVVANPPATPSRLNPDVPPELDELLLAMLEKDHARRPGAAAVAVRLRSIKDGIEAAAARHEAATFGARLRAIFDAFENLFRRERTCSKPC